MFRNMSNEGHFSGGQKPRSPTGHGVASAGLDSQESSWIGLFSVLSRPALSFLQKYVTGRNRNPNPSLSERGAGWVGGECKTSFVDEEREFLRRLDDMVPAPPLTYLHDVGAAGLLEPTPGSSVPWLTADSLRELGIQSSEEVNLNRTGHFSSIRTLLSHAVWSSSQELKPTGGKDCGAGGKTRTWWGSFWGGEDSSQSGLLSEFSWAEEGTVTGRLCPQQVMAETKAAETTAVFVQSSDGESTLGENTGPTRHKDRPADNGGLHTVQNTEGSTPGHRLSISDHLSSSGAAAACSEVALLTPDQDNGYSSLEEEQVQMSYLVTGKASGGEVKTSVQTEMEEETPEEGASTSGKRGEEEGTEEEQTASQEGESAGETVLSTPQCQNRAIAFIMGCPCSDDDSSQSEAESSDGEEDDGFDSEGSSNLSDSTDEDDDDEDSDSDSEADSEAERLWTSLCQSLDPYNPRNFTARLHTSSTLPRTIPTSSTPPSSAQSTPASSPQLVASSPTHYTTDGWDDSTSASEVDEAESLRLWSSFSSSSDPYSPFNFQAPLRTRGPAEAPPRAKSRSKKASQTPPHSPHHKAASPPEYRKEEAEERLDSGFSEHSTTSTTTQSCAPVKKVSLVLCCVCV